MSRSILVIDSSRVIRTLLQIHLQQAGHHVLVYSSHFWYKMRFRWPPCLMPGVDASSGTRAGVGNLSEAASIQVHTPPLTPTRGVTTFLRPPMFTKGVRQHTVSE